MEFRISTANRSTLWANCDDWTVEEIEELAKVFNFGPAWQMEFRTKKGV